MKKISNWAKCSYVLMIALSGNAAAGWRDVLDSAAKSAPAVPSSGQAGQALGNAARVMQNGQQAANAGELAQTGSLTDLLITKTGVTQTQAQGGAGALFQLAKSRMQAEAFSKLEQSVPGMQGLLGAASAVQQPAPLGGLAGKLTSLTGGTGGTAGSLVSLAAAFQQQGMSPQMVQQFIPIVVDYVKNSGGNALASTLSTALTGL
jgi:hypothetical protein